MFFVFPITVHGAHASRSGIVMGNPILAPSHSFLLVIRPGGYRVVPLALVSSVSKRPVDHIVIVKEG